VHTGDQRWEGEISTSKPKLIAVMETGGYVCLFQQANICQGRAWRAGLERKIAAEKIWIWLLQGYRAIALPVKIPSLQRKYVVARLDGRGEGVKDSALASGLKSASSSGVLLVPCMCEGRMTIVTIASDLCM